MVGDATYAIDLGRHLWRPSFGERRGYGRRIESMVDGRLDQTAYLLCVDRLD